MGIASKALLPSSLQSSFSSSSSSSRSTNNFTTTKNLQQKQQIRNNKTNKNTPLFVNVPICGNACYRYTLAAYAQIRIHPGSIINARTHVK
mmetsp:Transcript_24876/g.69830  ORF Transcript_24876/g.69830 Transcript_24876/m.69830 type:complete len:91 (+) Transcript_24876:465-737(+)